MSKELNVKNTMQPHSLAKIEFFQQYLEKFLAIMNVVDGIKQVRIYDPFCGRGIYLDGNKGSPIVAYETIVNVIRKNSNTKFKLILNDIIEVPMWRFFLFLILSCLIFRILLC